MTEPVNPVVSIVVARAVPSKNRSQGPGLWRRWSRL